MGSNEFEETPPVEPETKELDLTKEAQVITPNEVGDISVVLEATEVAAASPKQGKTEAVEPVPAAPAEEICPICKLNL
jgi:hypothetical protein